jgi:preprotein translocase subunit SecD
VETTDSRQALHDLDDLVSSIAPRTAVLHEVSHPFHDRALLRSSGHRDPAILLEIEKALIAENAQGDATPCSAQHIAGQWTIDLVLTDTGSAQLDNLAQQQFHQIIGVDLNGQVISDPITQPTQSSFAPFNGQVQISGGFTKAQAEAIAAELSG